MREMLERHGDFIFDMLMLVVLVVKDPPCRGAVLRDVRALLAKPTVKRNHLATALRKALRKILKSLDDADLRGAQ